MTRSFTDVAMPDFASQHFFETAKALRESYVTTGSAYLVALTALSMGLRVEFLRSLADASGVGFDGQKTFAEPRFYRVTGPKHRFHFIGSLSDRLRSRAGSLASMDKSNAKAVLHRAGVPTTFGGGAMAGKAKILDVLARAGVTRVVVKPLEGSLARGVLANVTLEHARTHLALNPSKPFIVEQYIRGTEFRVLTLGEKVISAILRVPLHVVGDGTSSLADLIEDMIAKQAANPFSAPRIRSRKSLTSYAEKSGRKLTSIPEAGETVRLAEKTIGSPDDVIDGTEHVSASLAKIAVKASKSVGCKLAGVDVIMTPAGECFVLEVNPKPDIFRHSFPLNGAANLTVPAAILRWHFPKLAEAARHVRRFDFLDLWKDYRENPDISCFDASDYADVK